MYRYVCYLVPCIWKHATAVVDCMKVRMDEATAVSCASPASSRKLYQKIRQVWYFTESRLDSNGLMETRCGVGARVDSTG